MTCATQNLLDELTLNVSNIVKQVQQLQQLDANVLINPPASGKWNVLQVIWHLESYNQYYLAAIHTAMATGAAAQPNARYTAGWLGDYFTRTMQPDAHGKVKGMKAPTNHTPAPAYANRAVLADFLASQQKLLQQLEAARRLNLQNIKVPISIAKWLKIRLGDTFRFLIAHQQRHMLQITNIVQQSA